MSHSAWEQAWVDRYATPGPAAGRGRRRAPLRELAVATAVLAITVSSVAVAGSGGGPEVSAARGEGHAVTLGERNPGSGAAGSETAIVANKGGGGLVLRPSNTAKGGRAVSATCDNDGLDAEDGCAVYVNKGKGAAASFRTQGSVPFALRDTNTGLVKYLNADMVDGKSASDFLTRGEQASDANTLDGQDSSAFLGASAKAADADKLDGQDSSAFLGATAKAADADKIDGIDSLSIARVSGGVFSTGNPTNIGYTSSKTGTGVYRVDFPAGTFKTSNSCKPPVPLAVSRSNTAVIVTIGDGSATCNAVDGSGGFEIRTFTAAGAAVDANIWFMAI